MQPTWFERYCHVVAFSTTTMFFAPLSTAARAALMPESPAPTMTMSASTVSLMSLSAMGLGRSGARCAGGGGAGCGAGGVDAPALAASLPVCGEQPASPAAPAAMAAVAPKPRNARRDSPRSLRDMVMSSSLFEVFSRHPSCDAGMTIRRSAWFAADPRVDSEGGGLISSQRVDAGVRSRSG